MQQPVCVPSAKFAKVWFCNLSSLYGLVKLKVAKPIFHRASISEEYFRFPQDASVLWGGHWRNADRVEVLHVPGNGSWPWGRAPYVDNVPISGQRWVCMYGARWQLVQQESNQSYPCHVQYIDGIVGSLSLTAVFILTSHGALVIDSSRIKNHNCSHLVFDFRLVQSRKRSNRCCITFCNHFGSDAPNTPSST